MGELGKTFDLTFSNRFLKLLTEGAVTTGTGMGDLLSPDSCYITNLTGKISHSECGLVRASQRCSQAAYLHFGKTAPNLSIGFILQPILARQILS